MEQRAPEALCRDEDLLRLNSVKGLTCSQDTTDRTLRYFVDSDVTTCLKHIIDRSTGRQDTWPATRTPELRNSSPTGRLIPIVHSVSCHGKQAKCTWAISRNIKLDPFNTYLLDGWSFPESDDGGGRFEIDRCFSGDGRGGRNYPDWNWSASRGWGR